MTGGFYQSFSPRRRDSRSDDDPFETVTVYMPKSLVAILKSKSDEKGLPVSRLVTIAVDNEIDVQEPFTYPCVLPEAPYVEYAYADEAGKLVKFLERMPKGLGRDSLMLARRDIGIFSRAEFMLAYRELLEQGIIEEYVPERTKYRYNRDYLYTRIVGLDPRKVRRNKYKKVEGETMRGDNGAMTNRDIAKQKAESDDNG